MIHQLEHVVEEILIEFSAFMKEIDTGVEEQVLHWLDEIEEVYSEGSKE